MRASADEIVTQVSRNNSDILAQAGAPLDSAFKPGGDVSWQVACLMVMQKSVDLTTSELEREVNMSCTEHGVLLRRLRVAACETYGNTMHLLSSFLNRCRVLETLVVEKQTEVNAMRAEMEVRSPKKHSCARSFTDIRPPRLFQVHESKMEEVFEAKLRDSTAQLTGERDAANERAAAAEEQIEKLNATLTTLNAIFKAMKDDNEAVRVADLRDTCTRLESRLQEKEAQLAQLTTVRSELRHQSALARSYKSRAESLARELEATQLELADRNALAQTVLQRESQRLAELEHITKVQGRTPAAAGGGGGSGAGGDASAAASEVGSRPSTRPGTAVRSFPTSGGGGDDEAEQKPHWQYPMLCVRCSTALDDLALVEDDDDKREEGRKHPVCMFFRVLLPMLPNGTRPSRSAPWAFWCMRAIILSKMTADMIAEREGSLRPRFPEFIYNWFEGNSASELFNANGEPMGASSRPTTAPGPTSSSASLTRSGTATPLPGSTAAAAKAARERDEARWSFYYTVRHLAREYPEAKLFYNFIDEKYGEDEVSFYLYCLRVLDGHTAAPILWGPTTYSSSFDSVPAELLEFPDLDVSVKKKKKKLRKGEKPEGAPKIEYPDVPVVPDKVWVGLNASMSAANTILARAKDDDRKASLWRLQGKAVAAPGRLYRFRRGRPAPADKNSAVHALEGLDGEGPVVGELVAKGEGASVGIPDDGVPKEQKCVDLGTFLRIMLLEYREEQAHRRAALRLMFDTAVAAIEGEKEQYGGRPGEARDDAARRRARKEAKRWEAGGFAGPTFSGTSVDFPQVLKIVKNIHSMVTVVEAAALYRDAYTLGNGGVNYESFLAAAEQRQLFSACLRLPAAYGSNKLHPLSNSQASHLT